MSGHGVYDPAFPPPIDLPDLVYKSHCGRLVYLPSIVLVEPADDLQSSDLSIYTHSGHGVELYLGPTPIVERERFRIAWLRAVAYHQWVRECRDRGPERLPETADNGVVPPASGASGAAS